MSEFKLLTERLLLRAFKQEDAPGFYAMNNDPQVLQYTGDVPFASETDAETFLRNYRHYEKYGYGRWTIIHQSTGKYLGFCGLKYHVNTDEVDLGFRLIREYWGHGYATEAALACLQYGFTTLGIPCIIGRAQAENLASIRVLEKIGMKFQRAFDFEGTPGVIYHACKK